MHSSCYRGFSAPAKDFLQHTTPDQDLDHILQDPGRMAGSNHSLDLRESRLQVADDPACRPSVYKCWAVRTAWANRMLPEVLSRRSHAICPNHSNSKNKTRFQKISHAFTRIIGESYYFCMWLYPISSGLTGLFCHERRWDSFVPVLQVAESLCETAGLCCSAYSNRLAVK